MNPDENARRTGHLAIGATLRTIVALENAIADSRWNEAARLFALVGEQAALGEQGCKGLASIKLEMN